VLSLLLLLHFSDYTTRLSQPSGQVAQLVERGPEKAGVGGSIPSLATNNFNNLATQKKRVKNSRAHNTRTSIALDFTFGVAHSINFHISRTVSLVIPCVGIPLRNTFAILIFEWAGPVPHEFA
jgi:hypothetical protein